MGRKKTTAEFVEDAIKVHGDKYDYSRVEYVSAKEKITILCPDHGEFRQRAKNHTMGQGCPICAKERQKNKITKSVGTFLLRLKRVHPLATLKSEYKNTYTKVLIDFGCGHEPNWVRPPNILKGQGCCDCRNESLAKSTNDFARDLEKVHPLAGLKSAYKNARTKVLIDFGCGHEPNWVTPNSVLSGIGCPKCAREKLALSQAKTTEEYKKELLEKRNGEYELCEGMEYYRNHTKVNHRHVACGHEWSVSPRGLLSGKGCPKCARSNGEKKVEQFLTQNDIPFWDEYPFPRCRDKSPLRFDFYLYNHKICIEYQGLQHYEAIDFFGGENQLLDQQRKDQIKREFCKKKGIILVEIPYDDERIAQGILGAIAQRKREREENPIQEESMSKDWGGNWVFGKQARLF